MFSKRGFIQFLPMIILGVAAIGTLTVLGMLGKTEDIRGRASAPCKVCNSGKCILTNLTGCDPGSNICAIDSQCPLTTPKKTTPTITTKPSPEQTTTSCPRCVAIGNQCFNHKIYKINGGVCGSTSNGKCGYCCNLETSETCGVSTVITPIPIITPTSIHTPTPSSAVTRCMDGCLTSGRTQSECAGYCFPTLTLTPTISVATNTPTPKITVTVKPVPSSVSSNTTLPCLDPCQLNTDCAANEYCLRPAKGCAVCKPKGQYCAPGEKKCSDDLKYAQVCNPYGTSWTPQSCGSVGCNTTTKVCNPTLTITLTPTPSEVCGQQRACGSIRCSVSCPSVRIDEEMCQCGVPPTPIVLPLDSYCADDSQCSSGHCYKQIPTDSAKKCLTNPPSIPTMTLTPTPANVCSSGMLAQCKVWGADGCVSPTGGIETCTLHGNYYYSQKDPRWANSPIWANATVQCSRDGIAVTFQQNGCALTTALTLLSEYVDSKKWNPGNFTNQYTSINHCYGISIDEGLTMLEDNGFTVGIPIDEAHAREYLKKGWKIWVTMVVTTATESFGHHSLITGVDSNGHFIFNDPYFGAGTTLANVHWAPMSFYPVKPPGM